LKTLYMILSSLICELQTLRTHPVSIGQVSYQKPTMSGQSWLTEEVKSFLSYKRDILIGNTRLFCCEELYGLTLSAGLLLLCVWNICVTSPTDIVSELSLIRHSDIPSKDKNGSFFYSVQIDCPPLLNDYWRAFSWD